jgi:hypothetical protein
MGENMGKDFAFYMMDTARKFNGEPFTNDMLYAELLRYETKNGQLLRNIPTQNKISWHLGRNKKDYSCVKRENKEGGRQTWYVLNPRPGDMREMAPEAIQELNVDELEKPKEASILKEPISETDKKAEEIKSINWMTVNVKVEPLKLAQEKNDAYAKLWAEKPKK